MIGPFASSTTLSGLVLQTLSPATQRVDLMPAWSFRLSVVVFVPTGEVEFPAYQAIGARIQIGVPSREASRKPPATTQGSRPQSLSRYGFIRINRFLFRREGSASRRLQYLSPGMYAASTPCSDSLESRLRCTCGAPVRHTGIPSKQRHPYLPSILI